MGPTLHFGWLVICYCPGAFTAYFVFNDTHLGFLSCFVALNITIAEDSCEASILKYLAARDTGIGSQHIVELLDHFRIQGPNRSHNVFVTKVLVPLTALAHYLVYGKVR